MALSDGELFAIWDKPWDENAGLSMREVEALSLRAVAEAAVAEFCREVMES